MEDKVTCDNPNCFNHDGTVFQFCDACLKIIASKLSINDIYELYVDCDNKLKEAVSAKNNKNTPNRLAEAKKCRDKLFNTINELLLLKQ